MSFTLSGRSQQRLQGVHADLVSVIRRALELSTVDFGVAEGMRSLERQRELFAAGKSRTMASRHLTGHAADLYPTSKAGTEWQRADFEPVVAAMKRAAQELGVSIQAGQDWKSFPDSPHFELDRKVYP